MGCVYILVGPTHKVYVGKTVNKSWRSYLQSCAKQAMAGSNSKPKLYRAFRKHGPQNFRAFVLFESDSNEILCAWEKYHIADQMSVEHGYNISSGGEGAGYKHGPDCKHCLWCKTEGIKLLRANRHKIVYPPKKEKIKKGWTLEQRTAAAERLQKQREAHPEWRGCGARARWKNHTKKPATPVSQEQIRRNVKEAKNVSSSKYVGVRWELDRRKWLSKIYFNKKRKFLGRFDTELEAAKAYDDAAKQYLGLEPINIV